MRNNVKYNLKSETRTVACCSRRQKVWGVVALLGLFACGWMVGASVNKWRADMNKDASVTVAAEVSAPVASNNNAPRECELIEDYINHELELSTDADEYAQLYELLIEYSCPEKVSLYRARYNVHGIKNSKNVASQSGEKRLCERVENELLRWVTGDTSAFAHEANAKTYANLAERGCPENKTKYTELARQELELMRALTDDNMDQDMAMDAARTYKRLQMQAAAEDVLDKVKKLTNPAIDFIMEMERIINE